jgi:hypothetical protein
MLVTMSIALALLQSPVQAAKASDADSVQGPTRFRGPNNEIEIWPFRRISVSVFGAGAFTVEGDPATIRWKDAGLVFTATSMNGELGVEQGRGYFVKSASFQGDAAISYDTNRIAEFVGERTGSPPPETEGEMQMVVKSATLAYTGGFDIGTIKFDSAFQLSGSMKGKSVVAGRNGTVPQVFSDTMNLAGVSGEVGVRTHVPAGGMPLRTGYLAGPIDFHYRRETVADGQTEVPLDVNGVADRLEFDFVSDTHTVTLIGNVRIEGTQGAYQGSTSGDRAVLTFGAKNELVNITVEGRPAESNLKPRPKTGGGR